MGFLHYHLQVHVNCIDCIFGRDLDGFTLFSFCHIIFPGPAIFERPLDPSSLTKSLLFVITCFAETFD